MNTSATTTPATTTPATVIAAADASTSKGKGKAASTKASTKPSGKASTKASTKPSTKATASGKATIKADKTEAPKGKASTKPAAKVEADKPSAPTKMSRAIEILKSVYLDETIEAPRRVVVARFREELGMKSTTASTYVGLVQAAIMNTQSEEVAEKVERAEQKGNKNPSVFSAFRTGSGTLSESITFAGTFLTREDAVNVCKTLRLPLSNIVRGVVTKGQTVIFPERKSGKVIVQSA